MKEKSEKGRWSDGQMMEGKKNEVEKSLSGMRNQNVYRLKKIH